MGKPLTQELIIQKTKTDQLSSIRNLNLWGNDIDDLRELRRLPNLEVLSLSVNRITTLRDIAPCVKLQELYLRKNLISDIRELRYLQNLPNLKVLWLQNNPCADIVSYREIVLKCLPNLTKLDNTNITQEDRVAASQFNFNLDADDEEPSKPIKEEIYEAPAIAKESPYRMEKKYPIQQSPAQQATLFQLERDIPQPTPQQSRVSREDRSDPTENILQAVLTLFKELDENSLEVAKRDIEKRLSFYYINHQLIQVQMKSQRRSSQTRY